VEEEFEILKSKIELQDGRCDARRRKRKKTSCT
jgi:hypothetical protein